jgi:hypothetical protein
MAEVAYTVSQRSSAVARYFYSYHAYDPQVEVSVHDIPSALYIALAVYSNRSFGECADPA